MKGLGKIKENEKMDMCKSKEKYEHIKAHEKKNASHVSVEK